MKVLVVEFCPLPLITTAQCLYLQSGIHLYALLLILYVVDTVSHHIHYITYSSAV
jgi:hypothetical protein